MADAVTIFVSVVERLPPEFIVNDVKAFVFTSKVTVTPELITTSSLVAGTGNPPQVAVLFQLPVTDAVLMAEFELPTINTNSSKVMIKLFESFIENIDLEGKVML